MKVSNVSVSRSAAPPHCGQVVLRHSGSALIGDCTPMNFTSSGKTTGNWSSGTGTAPQSGQLNDRNRTAPVTLAADSPVTQAIIDFALTDFFSSSQDHGLLFGCSDCKTVKPFAVDGHAVSGIGFTFPLRRRCTVRKIGRSCTRGKIPVSLILSGHGHDGSGAVSHQYIVSDIQRHWFASKWIEQVGTGDDTTFVQATFH